MIGEIMKLQETLAFDDVLLVPQYSDIESRKQTNISSWLDDTIKLKIPIISSPMDTVTGEVMACEISILGGLGIIHRYNTPDQQADMVKYCKDNEAGAVGAAVGSTGDFLERTEKLLNAGVNVLCVDVAHGDHISVKNAIAAIRGKFGYKIHIMAGNVATKEAFERLSDWGADSIRVGVGGGSICSTRVQTGHGVPTFWSVSECSNTSKRARLIADGGIKTSGDIVKSLAAGADFVMLGSMLAGTDVSPGDVFEENGKQYKVYRGMASKEAQIDWKGTYSSFEGVASRVAYKGHLPNILEDITRNIRSGLSYSGAKDLVELRSKAKFIKQSSAAQIESSPHILIRHG
jgi:IMP dehydrogenase